MTDCSVAEARFFRSGGGKPIHPERVRVVSKAGIIKYQIVVSLQRNVDIN